MHTWQTLLKWKNEIIKRFFAIPQIVGRLFGLNFLKNQKFHGKKKEEVVESSLPRPF